MRLRTTKLHLTLVLAVVSVAFLPMIGAFFRWGGLPPGFFATYPASHSFSVKPGPSWWYYGAGLLSACVILAFLFVPKLFGFRERGNRNRHLRDGGRLPWWFYVGLTIMLASWYEHWFGTSPAVRYSFMPLWWGFIVTIDGIVFFRTGGRSMLATEFDRFIVIAIVSMPAWGFFEVMNYYACEFWVYPHTELFPPVKFALWHFSSFSVVLPAIFEWYTLLHTFDSLWNRWHRGPAISIRRRSTWIVFAVGAISLVLFGALPFELLPVFWLGPPCTLAAALVALRFWTPFRPIATGNWSPAVLVALASLANGFFWEIWNWGSEHLRDGPSLNPNYWYYEIPYVNWPHLYSEMPVLGYFGYLPFGVLAWVCWLVAAHLLDLEPSFALTTPKEELFTGPEPAVISP
jgi:hypothetical protein